MPGSAGLNQEQRKELGLQYVDVGIAEEQAVAMASGAAKNGAKPLVGNIKGFHYLWLIILQ